jgi:hypothetical protein
MISDGVQASGHDTLVNIQIEGIWRRVTLKREAIERYMLLTPEAAAAMSPAERCDFVRSNLAYVFATVRRKIKRTADARRIVIQAGEL